MRSFQIEVIWDGHAVPDVVWASALSTTTDVITYRDLAGGVYKLPGGVETTPVTLRQGSSPTWPSTSGLGPLTSRRTCSCG